MMLLAEFDNSTMPWFIAAAGAALLAIGKDSPLAKVLGVLKAAKEAARANAPSVPVPVADGGETLDVPLPAPRTVNDRLPAWISDANDLQQMLLFLANHAAKNKNIKLKDATLELMKPYADLQVSVQGDDADNESIPTTS